jgi:hypothetical protein
VEKAGTTVAITESRGGDGALADSIKEGQPPVLGTGQTGVAEDEGDIGVLGCHWELTQQKRDEEGSRRLL